MALSLRMTAMVMLSVFICTNASSQTLQTESKTTDSSSARPKVALVLSGGGARGFAHIGVLRALRRMQIPIDMVVGTSMGAVVGGAYAAGRTPEQLEEIVRSTRWDEVLADRPARNELEYRRKIEDTLLPTRIEMAVTKSGVYLPKAAAGNASLEHALTRLLPDGMRDQPVNQLSLPFTSVASDLTTGDLVELNDTPLLASMRASLAVPGVFAPVRIKEKLVVDGGLVSNLPVELARSMGADIVIAVNVGTPLSPEKDIHSAFDVANQMLQILTEQNVQRSIKQLQKQDVLIAPKLDGISFLDFSAFPRAIKAGEQAVELAREQLVKLALPREAYAELEEFRVLNTRHAKDTVRVLPIASLDVKGTQYVNPDALIAQTGLQEGQNLTQDEIRQAATRLYGRGDLEEVKTVIDDSGNERKVTIMTRESQSSRNRLRLGMELSSDFNDDSRFALSLMHVASSLNGYGAELRTLVKVGSQQQFSTQFWQPLAPASAWYVAPGLEYNASGLDFYQGTTRIARINSSQTGMSFALGRQLGNWGSVEAGIQRGFQKINAILPSTIENDPKARYFATTRFIHFHADTLDSISFPTSGSMMDFVWQSSPGNDGNQPGQASAELSGMKALSFGEWAGHLYGEWTRAQNTTTPSPLGGFLRLTGLPRNSLYGDTTLFGRLVVARRIGALPSTIGGAVRLGFSMELGGSYGGNEPYSFGRMRQAASASLSVDTRFGPVYLGAGATRGAGSGVYLFLGPIW